MKFGIGRKSRQDGRKKQKEGIRKTLKEVQELDAACRSVDGEISEVE